MAVSLVDKKLLKDLEAMGFPLAKATHALQHSGHCSLEDEHDTEPTIDGMSPVPIKAASRKSHSLFTDHVAQGKADESRKKYLKRKRHYETQFRSKKAKETHQVVAGQPETSEIQRESNIDSRKIENDDAKRATTSSVQKLEEDMHRQLCLGLPSKNAPDVNHAHTMKLGNTVSGKCTKRVELLRECLRSIKGNHQGGDGEIRTTFRTLSTYVRNVLKNPNEEKFKRIRVANPNFRSRVGEIRRGIEFLHLCGFEWTEGGDFLQLPCNKVDLALLNSAGKILDSALSNRFFGMLSTETEYVTNRSIYVRKYQSAS